VLLDLEGSLNLKLEADFYVDFDGIAEILHQEEHNMPSQEDSFKLSQEILLASLLVGKVTLDVIVSLRSNVETDVELGSFFCHSSIVSSDLTI